ncbi:MAG: cupin domain-containing protein [Pseudomonadales bacterium]
MSTPMNADLAERDVRQRAHRVGLLWLTLSLLLVPAVSPAASSPVLFQKLLADVDNREVLLINVEYAPGESTPLHRHNAHTLVYVVEGAIEMQVEGGPLTRVDAGEVFYETPEDIHTVSRNASDEAPAKFIVFFVKKPKVPATVMGQ